MRLYAKVILLLCAVFAVYAAIDLAVQRKVILPSFESLEEDLARTDMERVNRALDDELAQLLLFGADWGNWLETYRYMAGENPAFIDDNMTPSTVEAARLDAVAFLDPQANFVWRQGYDPATHAVRRWAVLDGAALDPGHPFRRAIAAGEQASGLVLTEYGPAMAMVAPVLDGAGNGPHRGAVMLMRVITDEVTARLAEQAQVRLTVTPLPRHVPPGAEPAAASAATPAAGTRLVRHDAVNEVFRVLDDVYGRDAVQLHIEVPRSVSARGRDAIDFATLSLALAGVLVLVVLLVALRIMVLGPVTRLTRHAVAIAEGGDLSRRTGSRRGDELGVLARELDRMVEQLADTRRRLVDQSFEAGAAEVASGLLHNVGNAMTPLGVSVASVQKQLREAPAGEVALALGELERRAADPARRADLEQLLRLASRELAEAVARAAADAEAAAGHAEAIQRILAHSLRGPGNGPVVETAPLAAAIERGVQMVAPAMQKRLQVVLDASVHALGALPLPRTMLQQVVQNLVLNAAESVRDAGRAQGTLGIAAAVEDGRLVLRFTDDGGGIEPDRLAQIFEKGYSTKPRGSNLGIGLHWCANAVGAVGGRMCAESPGPGRGATLQVTLPLAGAGSHTDREAA
jgi:sensor domain CHASE-containing protein